MFYAEDRRARHYFAAIIRHLTGPLGRAVCYLTSDADDPILRESGERLSAFFIGTGTLRTLVFTTLAADVMVMTMPDLQTFHLKRSHVHDVHYVYVFHALVSTHMVYRPAAFDAFDTVLCAGPHHRHEIRARERCSGLPPKHLVPHGYGALDDLLARADRTGPPRRKCVVVAPSWGPGGLLENHARAVLQPLLSSGWQVIVRPHPRTLERRPDVHRLLRQWSGEARGLVLDDAADSRRSWADAELMISDWSGAALEYAFAYRRPVLYVDVPRKVNNPGYSAVAIEPLEVGLRQRLGSVLPIAGLGGLTEALNDLRHDAGPIRQRIESVRRQVVFNLGCSGPAGAACIAALADQRREAAG